MELSERRKEARRIWEESRGKKPLKEIAAELGVAEGTLRSWKNRDGWGRNVAQMRKDATQRINRRHAQVNRHVAESIEKNTELTEIEKEFCIAVVSTPNPTQAALSLNRYSTYRSAKTMAWDMMRRPTVQKEIKRLKEIKRSMLLCDADDIIDMHMRIAFADMSAFVEWGREEVPVMGPFGPIEIKDLETGKKVVLTKMVNVIRFKEQDQVDGAVIAKIKQGKDGAMLELADRQKSLEFLERYFELNPMDRHKKEYDRKRLALEERSVKVQEDKLHGMSADVETIKNNLRELMDIVRSPVPNRTIDDE